MPTYPNPNAAPPAPVRTPAPPAAPLPPVAGLPADAPKVVINGGVYSERRDVRAAIVDGKVVHEGADLGSGLILQEIGPSGVVLGWRGSRYTVVY
jgi:general secretion pathway protein B